MFSKLRPEAAPCAAWAGVARTVASKAAMGICLALSACGMPRMIDSEVQSFVGTPPAVAGATYRFERLPSQQSQAPAQDSIETLAQTALQRVGLTPSPSGTPPRYRVQLQTQVVQFQPVSTRKPGPIAPYGRADGSPMHSPLQFWMQPLWYGHSVHLVLRDNASGQVAYETQARFDGPWSDSLTLWPAILEAALRDYPHPSAGVRTVTIELPPRGTSAP